MNIYRSGRLKQIVYTSLLTYSLKTVGHTVNVEICQTDLFNPEVIALIAQLDAYQDVLYPVESNHAVSIESMRLVRTFAYIAKLEGKAVGCAILFLPNTLFPEIKRVFVSPEHRGYGIATILITSIINRSNVLDISEIFLETGTYQPDAIQLYRRLGFEVTSAFGDYQHDASSIYMMKSLGEVS
ncbi:GNAT family N-acetyltransferase [Yersinia massiliensis]|uniref:GNAT family N-acetyltransferase n=1 Tax=Yersinia massiliensis TaxID=419257 RepID=UPI00299DB60B|nr:GNAT family N-acetyltransferase [Yersinia massiliensis]